MAIKKNEILPFAAAWMDVEGIMLSETSQSEKDKYAFIYMWSLKNKNKQRKRKQTHRKETDGCQRGGGLGN